MFPRGSREGGPQAVIVGQIFRPRDTALPAVPEVVPPFSLHSSNYHLYMLDSIGRALGDDRIPSAVYNETHYNLPGGAIPFTSSFHTPVQRVGPFYFVNMPELAAFYEMKPHDLLMETQIHTDIYSRRLFHHRALKDFRDKIHIIHPESAVPGFALNNFSSAMIACMVETAPQFRKALVIDAGASYNPVLSLVAGLSLDARQVLMSDKSQSSLDQAYWMAEIQRTNKGVILPNLFNPCYGDLTKQATRDLLTRRIRESNTPVVGLVNMGPWAAYKGANRDTVEMLAREPNVSLVINGGYNLYVGKEYHGAEFARMSKALTQWGFRVTEVRHTRYSGTLIAQRD